MELDMAAFEELKQMSGEDFIGELIDTFLEDSPKLVAEMKAALKAQDADSFRRAAHSLKSNSATFGANHLAQLSRDLEMIGKENRLSDAEPRLPALEEALQRASSELKDLQT
jgi:histidine phosphotransfer protein HptB